MYWFGQKVEDEKYFLQLKIPENFENNKVLDPRKIKFKTYPKKEIVKK